MKLYSKINIIQTVILIIIIYILFIIYIAFIKFNISSDLISEHYYKEEIQYQKIIHDKINAKPFFNKIIIKFTKDGMKIIFPQPFHSKNIIGELVLIRFSDRKQDIYQKIKLNNENVHFISSTKLKNGLYKLQLKWIDKKDISYCIEKTIIWNNSL